MAILLKDRLIYARTQSGFAKPKHAADAAKITPSALYQLEDGTTKSLSGATAEKLAQIYKGFRIEWLISGTGPERHESLRVNEMGTAYESQELRTSVETICSSIKLLLSILEIRTQSPALAADPVLFRIAHEVVSNAEEPLTDSNLIDFMQRFAAKLRSQGDKDGVEQREDAAAGIADSRTHRRAGTKPR